MHRLTPAEKKVYDAIILQNMTIDEAASYLHRSPRTIKHHITSILSKRNCESIKQLVWIDFIFPTLPR